MLDKLPQSRPSALQLLTSIKQCFPFINIDNPLQSISSNLQIPPLSPQQIVSSTEQNQIIAQIPSSHSHRHKKRSLTLLSLAQDDSKPPENQLSSSSKRHKKSSKGRSRTFYDKDKNHGNHSSSNEQLFSQVQPSLLQEKKSSSQNQILSFTNDHGIFNFYSTQVPYITFLDEIGFYATYNSIETICDLFTSNYQCQVLLFTN